MWSIVLVGCFGRKEFEHQRIPFGRAYSPLPPWPWLRSCENVICQWRFLFESYGWNADEGKPRLHPRTFVVQCVWDPSGFGNNFKVSLLTYRYPADFCGYPVEATSLLRRDTLYVSATSVVLGK